MKLETHALPVKLHELGVDEIRSRLRGWCIEASVLRGSRVAELRLILDSWGPSRWPYTPARIASNSRSMSERDGALANPPYTPGTTDDHTPPLRCIDVPDASGRRGPFVGLRRKGTDCSAGAGRAENASADTRTGDAGTTTSRGNVTGSCRASARHGSTNDRTCDRQLGRAGSKESRLRHRLHPSRRGEVPQPCSGAAMQHLRVVFGCSGRSQRAVLDLPGPPRQCEWLVQRLGKARLTPAKVMMPAR